VGFDVGWYIYDDSPITGQFIFLFLNQSGDRCGAGGNGFIDEARCNCKGV